ncbi:MAG: dCMP deaminase [Ignavibacteriae bacterium]|nr:dCMP deaminase [Ignavibacteria bacterium]MBI3365729.1 dCMP deaminase [Ignavibacteriota bacterium]
MVDTKQNNLDVERLKEAIELSRKCTPVDRAFSVGAMVFDRNRVLVATGFSRENDPNVHAEEAALQKATTQNADLVGGTIYSSLEPCGRRLSGRKSCAERIIEAGITRVVFALSEPPVFVEATGLTKLRAAGVEVTVIDELADRVKEINTHLF